MKYVVYSDNNTSPLKINSIGFSSDPCITHFGPARRNLYIIHYIIKGKGYYNGNPVTEGQGFLIYPGQNEEYHPSKSNPWEFLWIISSDSFMNEIFERYNKDPYTLIFNYDSVPILRKIKNIIVSESDKILDSLKILGMFLQILNSHTYTQPSTKLKSNCEIYLDFCVDFIETNLYKKITVDELASLVGVSQPYLYKIFKNRFNMSTKDYITWYKMKKAKELLIETDMSITKIANSVGYSDVLAFSKAFLAKEKVSPKNYRLLNTKA